VNCTLKLSFIGFRHQDIKTLLDIKSKKESVQLAWDCNSNSRGRRGGWQQVRGCMSERWGSRGKSHLYAQESDVFSIQTEAGYKDGELLALIHFLLLEKRMSQTLLVTCLVVLNMLVALVVCRCGH